MQNNLIVVTGPTATGKTKFAVDLAIQTKAEIISADSRQVFRGMDLGTGKDLTEYSSNGITIPYHLIDILDPGQKYSVYRFQKDFFSTYDIIKNTGKNVILCGGTGLYIESVVKNYQMPDVPANEPLRKSLENKSLEELASILSKLKIMHNSTDIDTPKRAIRAIEIATFEKNNSIKNDYPKLNSLIFGLHYERAEIRKRITQRLKQRIDEGMIDETNNLLKLGIDPDVLISYGLEYKYTTWFLQNKISQKQFFEELNTAIHQFAKRQVTWFRRMERSGIKIHWIDGALSASEKLNKAKEIMGLCGYL